MASLKAAQVQQVFSSIYYQLYLMSARDQILSALSRYRAGNTTEANWGDVSSYLNYTFSASTVIAAAAIYDVNGGLLFFKSNDSATYTNYNQNLFPISRDQPYINSMDDSTSGYITAPQLNNTDYLMTYSFPVMGNSSFFTDSSKLYGFISIIVTTASFKTIIEDTTGLTNTGLMYLIGLKSTNDSKRVESISETTAATSALFQTMSSKSLQPSPTDSNSSLSNSNLFNSNFSNLENLVTNNFNKEINTTKTNLLHQKIQSDIPNSNLRQKAKDIATTTTAFPATPTTNSAIADADSFRLLLPPTGQEFISYDRLNIMPVSFIHPIIQGLDHSDSGSLLKFSLLDRPVTAVGFSRVESNILTWVVIITEPISSVYAPVTKMRNVVLISAFGSLGVLTPIVVFLVNKGVQPIYQLKKAAEDTTLYFHKISPKDSKTDTADASSSQSSRDPPQKRKGHFGLLKASAKIKLLEKLKRENKSSLNHFFNSIVCNQSEKSRSIPSDTTRSESTLFSNKDRSDNGKLLEIDDTRTDKQAQAHDTTNSDKATTPDIPTNIDKDAANNDSHGDATNVNLPIDNPVSLFPLSTNHSINCQNLETQLSRAVVQENSHHNHGPGNELPNSSRSSRLLIPPHVDIKQPRYFTDELVSLQYSFNRMADELEKQYLHLEDMVRERTKELEAAKDQALNANQAKSLFIANITHELRTPLNGILGMTAVSLTESDPSRIKRSLRIISKSGEVLLQLINDLLTYSKNQVGNVKMDKSEFVLGEIIKEINGSSQKRAATKLNIRTEFSFEPSNATNMVLLGDRGRITHILLNALHNSVKFAHASGSVTFNVKCTKINNQSVDPTSLIDSEPGRNGSVDYIDTDTKTNSTKPRLPCAPIKKSSSGGTSSTLAKHNLHQMSVSLSSIEPNDSIPTEMPLEDNIQSISEQTDSNNTLNFSESESPPFSTSNGMADSLDLIPLSSASASESNTSNISFAFSGDEKPHNEQARKDASNNQPNVSGHGNTQIAPKTYGSFSKLSNKTSFTGSDTDACTKISETKTHSESAGSNVLTTFSAPKTCVLRFEVADQGPGINPSIVKHIFEPFVQEDQALSRRFGGAGLGLSICKQLVELMGGNIDLISKPGIGLTVVFEIPLYFTRMFGKTPSPNFVFGSDADVKKYHADTENSLTIMPIRRQTFSSISLEDKKETLGSEVRQVPPTSSTTVSRYASLHKQQQQIQLLQLQYRQQQLRHHLMQGQQTPQVEFSLPQPVPQDSQSAAIMPGSSRFNFKLKWPTKKHGVERKQKQGWSSGTPQQQLLTQTTMTSSPSGGSGYFDHRPLAYTAHGSQDQPTCSTNSTNPHNIGPDYHKAMEFLQPHGFGKSFDFSGISFPSPYDSNPSGSSKPVTPGSGSTATVKNNNLGSIIPMTAGTTSLVNTPSGTSPGGTNYYFTNRMSVGSTHTSTTSRASVCGTDCRQNAGSQMGHYAKGATPGSTTDSTPPGGENLHRTKSQSSKKPLSRTPSFSRFHKTVQIISPKSRILVAEDNLINQDVIRRMLKLEGIKDIEMAMNGEQAVYRVEESIRAGLSYDIVFLDIQMPRMDGLQACRIIRNQLAYEYPIVALTAYADQDSARQCFEAGMDNFLEKPIRREKLYNILHQYCSTLEEEEGEEKGVKQNGVESVETLRNLSHQDPSALLFQSHSINMQSYEGIDYEKMLGSPVTPN